MTDFAEVLLRDEDQEGIPFFEDGSSAGDDVIIVTADERNEAVFRKAELDDRVADDRAVVRHDEIDELGLLIAGRRELEG